MKRILPLIAVLAFSCQSGSNSADSDSIESFSIDSKNIESSSGGYFSESAEKSTIDICTFALDKSSYIIAKPSEIGPIVYRSCDDGLPYSSTYQEISFDILESLSPEFDGKNQVQAIAIKGSFVEWDAQSTYIISIREDNNEWFVTGLLPIVPNPNETEVNTNFSNETLVINLPTNVTSLNDSLRENKENPSMCQATYPSYNSLSDENFRRFVRELPEGKCD